MIGYVIAGLGIYLMLGKKTDSKTTENPVMITPVSPVSTNQPAVTAVTGYDARTDKYDSIFSDIGNSMNIPWQVLKAFAAVESDYGNASWYVSRIPLKTPDGIYKAGIAGNTDEHLSIANRRLGSAYRPSDVWTVSVSMKICAAVLLENESSLTAGTGNVWNSLMKAVRSGQGIVSEIDSLLSAVVKSYGAGFADRNNPKYDSYYSLWKTVFNSIIARQGADTAPAVK